MSTKLSAEEAKKLAEQGKIGKIDLNIDANSPEARAFTQEILHRKDEQQGIPSASEVQQLKEDLEDARNKLGIIAEREGERKRKIVTDKINSLVVDPEKRAQFLEQVKTDKLDIVSALDKTMDLLSDTLKKSNNERFEPAGSPLVSQQYGGAQNSDDIYSKKFPDYNSMIQALRTESKSEDKQKAQHASDVLNTLLIKYAQAQKNQHTERRYSEDDAIPKTDKVPTRDFSQTGTEPYSELERFGIRKSPLNYTQTQRRIVTQKPTQEGS